MDATNWRLLEGEDKLSPYITPPKFYVYWDIARPSNGGDQHPHPSARAKLPLMFRLDQKTALVTGAASGIGEAIAHTLARAGAFVVVCDRDEAGGHRVVEALRVAGGAGEFAALDVSDADQCERVAGEVLGVRGRVDILVNNAGIGAVGTILEADAGDLARLWSVNVAGVWNLSRALLPSMIRAGGGAVVNMASIGGTIGIRDRAAYCTTKFAVVGLTKGMALDHAAQGVRVNCICPGRVETPFVAARIAEYPDPQAAYAQMSATQALGRMARPEEIAAAALYLSSDEAAFITGTAFLIDGGWSAGK